MKSTITLPKDPKPGTSFTFQVKTSDGPIEIISPGRSIDDNSMAHHCLASISKGDSVIIESVVVDFERDNDGNLQPITEWIAI